MLWNLDTSWLLMAVAVVGLLSFLLGLALNALIGRDGFGPIGNAVIVTAGFFLGIFLANSYGLVLRDLTLATATGLTGAFVSLAMLALVKAGLAWMLDRA